MASIHLPADTTRQVLDDQPEVGASRRSVLLHPNWFSLSVVVIRAFTAPEIGQSNITFEIIFWINKLIKNSILNFKRGSYSTVWMSSDHKSKVEWRVKKILYLQREFWGYGGL
jgi:hypothetical protein